MGPKVMGLQKRWGIGVALAAVILLIAVVLNRTACGPGTRPTGPSPDAQQLGRKVQSTDASTRPTVPAGSAGPSGGR